MSAAQDRPVQVNYHLSDSFTPEVDLRVSPPEGFWSDEPHLYAAGVELFHQGDPAVDLYFVQDGLLKLVRSEDDGHEFLLDLRFSGSLIGAAAVIRKGTHPFSAITVTVCKLTRIGCREFLRVLAKDFCRSAFVIEF